MYCDPFDPDGLAETISSVLYDDDLRRRLAVGGTEHLRKFTPDALRESMRNFYSRLVV